MALSFHFLPWTTLVVPRACGSDVVIQPPGLVFTAYVTIGYSNGRAVQKLQRAFELLEAAARELPSRKDLAEATQLLARACGTLAVVSDT